jgi:hypothetical protein
MLRNVVERRASSVVAFQGLPATRRPNLRLPNTFAMKKISATMPIAGRISERADGKGDDPEEHENHDRPLIAPQDIAAQLL